MPRFMKMNSLNYPKYAIATNSSILNVGFLLMKTYGWLRGGRRDSRPPYQGYSPQYSTLHNYQPGMKPTALLHEPISKPCQRMGHQVCHGHSTQTHIPSVAGSGGRIATFQALLSSIKIPSIPHMTVSVLTLFSCQFGSTPAPSTPQLNPTSSRDRTTAAGVPSSCPQYPLPHGSS